MEDKGAKNAYIFPDCYVLVAGFSLRLISGTSREDLESATYWTSKPVWNNDHDTAALFDREGNTITERKCD